MNNSTEIKKNVPQVLPDKRKEAVPANTVNEEQSKTNIVGLANEINSLKQNLVRLENENEKLKSLVSMNIAPKEDSFENTEGEETRIKELIKERDRYKALAVEKIKENILNDIKKEFSDVKINSIDELPKGFHALVAAKVAPSLAYRVVMESEKSKNEKIPSSMGEVNSQSEKEKEFYSSAEVDKLTKKQLSNPKVMNAVMKSMLKW